MINSPTDSQARQPRGLVKVNGEFLPFISWEVENNNFYQADNFNATFAVSALPPAFNAIWFAAQSQIMVEVFAGFPVNPDSYTEKELVSLIYGRVDSLDWNVNGTTLSIAGRDMTSAFIDAKTDEKFQNQTASQIAEAMAKRHGLNPIVTATEAKSGAYYEIDHSRMTHERSEWDLLTFLANENDFAVYVQSKNLYFGPKPDPKQPPYLLQWQNPTKDNGYSSFNGTQLAFARNLTLAQDVIVTIRSWNLKTGKVIIKTAHATHNQKNVISGLPQPVGEAQKYVRTIPGLTPEQALQRAQSMLAEISSHELRVNAELPGDTTLSLQNMIKVTGTGSDFDTVYFPNTITRSMSINEGFRMHIQGKNHPTESETLV